MEFYYLVLLIFIARGFAQDQMQHQHSNFECKSMLPRPNMTESSMSSADMMTSWVCDLVEWRCELKKWLTYYNSRCDGGDMMHVACPDYNVFDCGCGMQKCQQDAFGCSICVCEGGKFRSSWMIQNFYGKEKALFRGIMERYRSCVPTSSGCNNGTDSGEGSGGEESGDYGSGSGMGSGSDMGSGSGSGSGEGSGHKNDMDPNDEEPTIAA